MRATRIRRVHQCRWMRFHRYVSLFTYIYTQQLCLPALRRLHDNFNRVACISEMRGRTIKEKKTLARLLIKITKSAYRVSARRLCRTPIYSLLFEIYDDCVCVWLFLFRLIKLRVRVQCVLRTNEKERKRYEEKAIALQQLYKVKELANSVSASYP